MIHEMVVSSKSEGMCFLVVCCLTENLLWANDLVCSVIDCHLLS